MEISSTIWDPTREPGWGPSPANDKITAYKYYERRGMSQQVKIMFTSDTPHMNFILLGIIVLNMQLVMYAKALEILLHILSGAWH